MKWCFPTIKLSETKCILVQNIIVRIQTTEKERSFPVRDYEYKDMIRIHF